MDFKINIAFKSLSKWQDSERRAEHVFERMRLRGISVKHIKEVVSRGAKQVRKDKSIIAEYRWLKVAYREFFVKNFRKIYPITVMEA